MPINLLKQYADLLELAHLEERARIQSLRGIFRRDIEENENLCFKKKQIRPIKKADGEPAMQTLFHHLTTRMDESEEGKKIKRRIFEMDRSKRLHWILFHVEERKPETLEIFSYEDRIDRQDKIRTYIYDKVEEYVIILEPQRSGRDYYLLTAYYLNEVRGKKQIKQKMKKKLPTIY
ncbi:MAG TPA: hypothetical protein PKC76_15390 [Saprospiraceae bacterium]|nr:hypothetical protein [Saprospiraceae bacterium]HMP25517.1 hypothetical protein [Saprospiraceae bacterium]